MNFVTIHQLSSSTCPQVVMQMKLEKICASYRLRLYREGLRQSYCQRLLNQSESVLIFDFWNTNEHFHDSLLLVNERNLNLARAVNGTVQTSEFGLIKFMARETFSPQFATAFQVDFGVPASCQTAKRRLQEAATELWQTDSSALWLGYNTQQPNQFLFHVLWNDEGSAANFVKNGHPALHLRQLQMLNASISFTTDLSQPSAMAS